MDSNTVLGKIMTLLSLNSTDDVKLAIARLADGTILESPTFDVGEMVEVVSEDGTKSPAPDGEHEIELRDEEDNVVRIKIITEGGVIKERENVELEEAGDKEEEMEAETIEVEPLPNTTDEDPANKVAEFAEELPMEDDEEKEVTINLEEVSKKVEEMAYRIDELEKKLQEKMEEEIKEEEELEEEEDDAKLDGAPVEMSSVRKNLSKNTVRNYHNSVLSRMYRN